MRNPARRFIDNNNIEANNVMYAYHDERKTYVVMSDERICSAYIPLKAFLSELNSNDLYVANKGIAVSKHYIKEDTGLSVIMTDGKEFTKRGKESSKTITPYIPLKEDISFEQYRLFDDFPIAFCIIEIILDDKGRGGMDFIFRYCNKQMEVFEGKTMDEMLNHSFYDVFDNADRKWLITYADVAVNGGTRILESYSPEINHNIKVYCYQPIPNYCGCVLMKI